MCLICEDDLYMNKIQVMKVGKKFSFGKKVVQYRDIII